MLMLLCSAYFSHVIVANDMELFNSYYLRISIINKHNSQASKALTIWRKGCFHVGSMSFLVSLSQRVRESLSQLLSSFTSEAFPRCFDLLAPHFQLSHFHFQHVLPHFFSLFLLCRLVHFSLSPSLCFCLQLFLSLFSVSPAECWGGENRPL